MNEVRNILLGIEISRDNAQLCYYDRSLKEPVSIPVKVGSNLCSFPMLLVKMKGKDEWHFGFEARFFEQQENGISVPNPYTAACSDERAEVDGREMEPYEPLAVFIREALCLLGLPHPVQSLSGICVTCPDLHAVLARNILSALRSLGLKAGQCFVCDRDESFFYYAHSLKPEIHARGLALIRFSGNTAAFSRLTESRATRPFAVSMEDGGSVGLPEEPEERDRAFAEAIGQWMKDVSCSGAFITGEGFSTEWARDSVKVLSRAASHVFEGDNLYVKGACYAVFEKTERHAFDGKIYLGPDTLKVTVGMDVIEGGQQRFLPLVRAGSSYYTEESCIEVILDGREDLLVTARTYDKSNHRNERILLEGLPERPPRTTRLEIRASCPSAEECLIRAEDLGFGELFPATHQVFEMRIAL